MPTDMLLTLVAVFGAAALLTGTIVALMMTRGSAVSRRRLHEIVQPQPGSVIVQAASLTPTDTSVWNSIAEILPTSRGTLKRLKRDLALAGSTSPRAAALMSISELLLPVVLAIPAFIYLDGFNRWIAVGMAVGVGYMAPGFILSRRINNRKKQIQNGLADLLDLLVLCLEAGSGLDQAIVKASDELRVAYPALADQLQIMIAEMRAGKPRMEAFKGLADRSQVDDVRALVSMLAQTDRFGTSISQSLRAQADVCRTKRRQRAEERAQKVSVKLVFPLVFCLFPALYVVLLGPAFIQFGRVLGSR